MCSGCCCGMLRHGWRWRAARAPGGGVAIIGACQFTVCHRAELVRIKYRALTGLAVRPAVDGAEHPSVSDARRRRTRSKPSLYRVFFVQQRHKGQPFTLPPDTRRLSTPSQRCPTAPACALPTLACCGSPRCHRRTRRRRRAQHHGRRRAGHPRAGPRRRAARRRAVVSAREDDGAAVRRPGGMMRHLNCVE